MLHFLKQAVQGRTNTKKLDQIQDYKTGDLNVSLTVQKAQIVKKINMPNEKSQL